MTVYESDLPGVGKKFEVELEDDDRLVIVTHNTGKREVYRKPADGGDSEKLFEVSDRLARTVGSILEGAYFQPVESERVETMLAEGTFLEWFNVDEGAEIASETLSSSHIRERTGVSVVAIQRDGTTIPSPSPDTVIDVGDTLVVIGHRENVGSFEALVSGSEDTKA